LLVGYEEGSVFFFKVDVDELSSASTECGIRQMPTFLIINKAKRLGQIIGWNDFDLKHNLEKQGAEQIIPSKLAAKHKKLE
jgi:hypothetical protein